MGSLGYPGEYGIGIFARVRAQKGIGILIDAMIPIMKKILHLPSHCGRNNKIHEGFVNELKEKIQNEGLEDRILFLGKFTMI